MSADPNLVETLRGRLGDESRSVENAIELGAGTGGSGPITDDWFHVTMGGTFTSATLAVALGYWTANVKRRVR